MVSNQTLHDLVVHASQLLLQRISFVETAFAPTVLFLCDFTPYFLLASSSFFSLASLFLPCLSSHCSLTSSYRK
jgi:hypothetical protein